MKQKHPMKMAVDRIPLKQLPDKGPYPTGVLYATHEGIWNLGGNIKLRVYQLNNGQRVLDSEDIETFFGIPHPREEIT